MDKDSNRNVDEALSHALGEWTVEEPLPPRFQEQVWHRISIAESARTAPRWRDKLAFLAAAICQPRFALGYLTVLVGIGVLFGSLTAQAQRQRVEKELGYRYVHTIDPQLLASSHP